MSELVKIVKREDNLSPEQIDLIKETVCKDATDNELKLFLTRCKRTGLDPFSGQIHAVKRWDSKQGKYIMSIQCGIDGYRLIAQRTGECAGIDEAVYDTDSGKHPNKASVTVYRVVAGVRVPFSASARWDEYVSVYNNKKSGEQETGTMWKKMPYLMLGKCAEALALRKAFPAELSGVYTSEEMEQADNPEPNGQKSKQVTKQSKPTFWSNPVVSTKAKISEAGNDAPKLRKLYDFIDNKWEEKGINADVAQQCLDEVLGALRGIEQSKPQSEQQGMFVQEPSPLGSQAMPAIPVVEEALNKSNEVLQKSKEVVSA